MNVNWISEWRLYFLEQKSLAFALRVVKLYKHLRENHESVIAKQVLRSGTSIGANIAEGNYAQSRDDFASKFGIALKEAAETHYWLVLLRKGGFIEEDAAYQSLLADCEELIRMLVASVKTIKANRLSKVANNLYVLKTKT